MLYCRETFLFDLLGVSLLREERNSFHVKRVQSPPVTDCLCCLVEPNYMQRLLKGSAVKKACVQMNINTITGFAYTGAAQTLLL